MQGLMVTKRNGQQEKIDLDKIHRVIDWAAEGLEDVSVSQVELKAHIQFFDGIRTSDIHETIIKSAADLISEETPDYQYIWLPAWLFSIFESVPLAVLSPLIWAHT